jgi:hypothetical protein
VGMTEDFGQHGTNAPAGDAARPWDEPDDDQLSELEEAEQTEDRDADDRDEDEKERRPERG